MTETVVSFERVRGCGYRAAKPERVAVHLTAGGVNLLSQAVPVRRKLCCGGGVKPARGWAWFEPAMLLGPEHPPGQHGLLWVGEAFYPTVAVFLREAAEQGVSRRVAALPLAFRLGTTRVYLAHRRAAQGAQGEPVPAIFGWFLPERVDLVVADLRAVPPRAERIAGRVGLGARVVQVVREGDLLTGADGTA